MTEHEHIDTRLEAARTRLILDKPFLGALVLRLPLIRANPDWCNTTATDARKFYYNPQYIESLNASQLQFVLAHEALHCALSHFARRGHRMKNRWDMACDYAINPLLADDGLEPPPGSLLLHEFREMTAEEIYPCIEEQDNLTPLDHHVYDADQDEGSGQQDNAGEGDSDDKSPQPKSSKSDTEQGDGGSSQQQHHDGEVQGGNLDTPQGSGDTDNRSQQGAPRPDPLSPQEIEALSTQWQQRMVGAAQQAMQAGKLGGVMARMIDFMVQPSLPWRMLLARYVTSIARDDYSYSRPSSRRGDPAIFPSLRSAQLNLAVAIDVSGSVNDREIGEFLSEINAIKSQIRSRVILMACDTALTSGCPWIYEPWEELTMPESIKGGGGTNFAPPIEHLTLADQQPDILVYFTDARGQFPAHEPAFPVIWLVKGRGSVPWGQRIQLN